jgi:hypothetical protein
LDDLISSIRTGKAFGQTDSSTNPNRQRRQRSGTINKDKDGNSKPMENHLKQTSGVGKPRPPQSGVVTNPQNGLNSTGIPLVAKETTSDLRKWLE